jgi:hypothetical protein
MGYVRTRHEAERRWHLRVAEAERRGSIGAAVDAIQAEYTALLEQFCTPKVVSLGLRAAFGDPPDVDPATTRVEAVAGRGGKIIVTTAEDTEPGRSPRTYEYVLEVEGDRLLIADRRTRDLGGKWIHRIL